MKKNILKKKTIITLPDQYSVSFTDNPEVLYIPVSIKINIGNDMYKGHYVCDVLYYNKGTCWNCDDETITQYPGYPMNVYND